MSMRFLPAFAYTCVAVVIGCSFSFEAVAADNEKEQAKHAKLQEATFGREQRKHERALEQRKKGNLKKATKLEMASVAAREKGERQFERALEFKKEGRFKKHVKSLRKSADSGNETAASFLELIDIVVDIWDSPKVPSVSPKEYLRSLDVDEVYAEAELGDGQALYLLGELFLTGIGVERSNAIAYAMFRHAEERGSGKASNLLTICTPRLETAELAGSERVYANWVKIIKKNQSDGDLASK